jgi:hypothetical protein
MRYGDAVFLQVTGRVRVVVVVVVVGGFEKRSIRSITRHEGAVDMIHTLAISHLVVPPFSLTSTST